MRERRCRLRSVVLVSVYYVLPFGDITIRHPLTGFSIGGRRLSVARSVVRLVGRWAPYEYWGSDLASVF